MSHNYLVSAQPATVVSASHTGYFNSPDELNTILIRGTRISVYAVTSEDGFQKINELPFYGRIIQSLMFRPPQCTTDHLFLLTQSFTFCIIATDPDTNQIVTKASGDLKEPNATIKASSNALVAIDSSQQNIVLHIYKGELILIQLDECGRLHSHHASAEKISIHELEILSLCFVHHSSSKNNATDSTNSRSDAPSSLDMNLDADDLSNDNNSSTSIAGTESISPKAKASKAIKSGLNKLKPTKVIEKTRNLRMRQRSRSGAASNDLNDHEEEKKPIDSTHSNSNSTTNASRSFSKGRSLLCVLYQVYDKGRHLRTYWLDRALYELAEGPWEELRVEEGSNRLMAVPPPFGGVMFVGQYSIAYRNGDNLQRVQVPDGDWCCFDCIKHQRKRGNDDDDDEDTEIDGVNNEDDDMLDGTRWLIGDGLNRTLNMLILEHSEEFTVKGLQLKPLGEIVSPCTVSYICSGLAFVGSTVGDSQFIEIHSDPDWRKKREEEDQEEEEAENEEDEDDDIAMGDDAENNDANVMEQDAVKNNEDEEESGMIEVLEEFTNLGPIVDMVSVDLERQGQCQLVTCSGVGRDGSLRVIKNGIGIEEVAEIEMEGIQGLWGLKESSESEYDKYLITSFISETRVLAMTEEGLEEMEMTGLNQLTRTVHCSNMENNDFCQIGETEINLIDLSTFQRRQQWKCSDHGFGDHIKINSCTTNAIQFLGALSSGNLILLEAVNHGIQSINTTKLEHEISCVSLSPPVHSDGAMNNDSSNKSCYCAVGMWKDYSVRILSLPDFKILLHIPLQTDIVPRSVYLTDFGDSLRDESYLFVGMGDGSLVETKLAVTVTSNQLQVCKVEVVKQKKIPLGTQPVRLVPFQCNGISYIFGGCDRPTVIYLLNRRMFYANVNLPEINYMTEFNAEDFPDCLAMSCAGNLMIGQMDEVQKLHITKIPLYEQPRRIAFHPELNCYLLASQTPKRLDKAYGKYLNRSTKHNFFHPAYNQTVYKLSLCDGSNLEDTLWSKVQDPHWNTTRIITHQFKCDPHVRYFVMTSCEVLPHEKSPSRGKVQVAMVINGNTSNADEDMLSDANSNGLGSPAVGAAQAAAGGDAEGTWLKIVHSKMFRGDPSCVRGLGEDYLLVGVRSKIQIFRWMLRSGPSDEDYPFELHHVQTIHSNTFVVDLKVHGDFFISIDLMRSVSMFLLNYTGNSENVEAKMLDGTLVNESGKNGQNGKTNGSAAVQAVVTEVARDYDPSWMKCATMYNDQFVVGIDAYCNMFVLKRNIDSLSDDERGRLDTVCRIHAGDDVNVILHGSLVMDIPYDADSGAITTSSSTSTDNENDTEMTTVRGSDKVEMDDSEDEGKDDEKSNTKSWAFKKNTSSYIVPPLRPTDLRKCVFGTIDGAIGVLISIPYTRYDVLQKLEKSLRKFVQGLGGLDHSKWREFKNQTDAKPAVGFLDGDLIETFLNLTPEQQQKVADDMKIDTESLLKIVEEMSRLH